MQSPTQARIDLGALRRNLARVRERSGERRVIGVVKADAYGHGAVVVGRALAEAGCGALAVATTAEAQALRAAGISAPLFLLQGQRLPEDADRVLALRAVPFVSSLEALPLLEAAGVDEIMMMTQMGTIPICTSRVTGTWRWNFGHTPLAGSQKTISFLLQKSIRFRRQSRANRCNCNKCVFFCLDSAHGELLVDEQFAAY